jgi:hypothetical protein
MVGTACTQTAEQIAEEEKIYGPMYGPMDDYIEDIIYAKGQFVPGVESIANLINESDAETVKDPAWVNRAKVAIHQAESGVLLVRQAEPTANLEKFHDHMLLVVDHVESCLIYFERGMQAYNEKDFQLADQEISKAGEADERAIAEYFRVFPK